MAKDKIYEIGQAYIRLDIKADSEFKEAYEQFLLYKGKLYAKEFYKKDLIVDGLYFAVELEDGTLKSRLKIFGKITITSLIAYGGIRTGIDYVIKDSQVITEHIARDVANEQSIGADRIGRVERRLGVPGKIKRLYNHIDKLSTNRNNLTENEQEEIIHRIQRNFEELIYELDPTEVKIILQELIQNQIPLHARRQDEDFFLPRHDAIREKDIRFISEDEIREPRQLPPPRQE